MIQIIRRWLYEINLPASIKKQLRSGLRDVYREIERWSKSFIYSFIYLRIHVLINQKNIAAITILFSWKKND